MWNNAPIVVRFCVVLLCIFYVFLYDLHSRQIWYMSSFLSFLYHYTGKYMCIELQIFYEQIRHYLLKYIQCTCFVIHIPAYWMGGSDRGQEGVWRWATSGSSMNYTNWYPGQPDSFGGNQDCLAIDSSGPWHDLPCSVYLRYICESMWVWVYVNYYILESVWVRKHMCVSVRIKT